MVSTVTSKPARRDKLYYIQSIAFLIEDCLFQVPRYCFQGTSFGTVFADLAREEKLGKYNENDPIELQGINKTEFRGLLKAMYPQYHIDGGNLSRQEWTAALKLSTIWMLENGVRARAIDALSGSASEMDAIKRISFAREHKVGPWLLNACRELVRRSEPFSTEEIEKLDWESTALPLLQARDVHNLRSTSAPRFILANTADAMLEQELKNMKSPRAQAVRWSKANTESKGYIERDQRCYIKFEDIIFLVEDYLFKIPRSCLTNESEVFRGMFALPTGLEGHPEGSTDDNPVVLEGVRETEFRAFLQAVYPLPRQQPDLTFASVPVDRVTINHEGWISVLKLSTMWKFTRIRRHAITQVAPYLSQMGTVERIKLGESYGVSKWLLDAYTDMVKREKAPSNEESKELGRGATLKVFRAREEYITGRRNASGSRTPLDCVRSVFAEELRDVGSREQAAS